VTGLLSLRSFRGKSGQRVWLAAWRRSFQSTLLRSQTFEGEVFSGKCHIKATGPATVNRTVVYGFSRMAIAAPIFRFYPQVL
jgi:hypothetical protein